MKKQVRRFVHLLFSLMFLAAAAMAFAGPASAADLVPLSERPVGSYIVFGPGGPEQWWRVVDPGTGCLIRSMSAGVRAFDPDNTNTFNPSDPNNIAYWLNNDFLTGLGLTPTQQALIRSHYWTTGNETNEGTGWVSAKIGLANYHEATRISNVFIPGTPSMMLRTSRSGSPSQVWYYSFSHQSIDANQVYSVYPVLYLDPDVLTSKHGTSGGVYDVIALPTGIPVITVVNGVQFSVTVDYTFGILTGTNATAYGTVEGVAGGDNGNVVSGTLSGLPVGTTVQIPLGAGLIEVKAVDPPSTTTDSSKSFY